MFGQKSMTLSFWQSPYFDNLNEIFFLGLGAFIIWFMPNTRQIIGGEFPALYERNKYSQESSFILQYNIKWAFFVSVLVVLSFLSMSGTSQFLYFQF
jgi:hypothetical protein